MDTSSGHDKICDFWITYEYIPLQKSTVQYSIPYNNQTNGFRGIKHEGIYISPFVSNGVNAVGSKVTHSLPQSFLYVFLE